MRSTMPERAAKRIREGFLFFPQTIGRETRWWERARWEEKVVYWYGAFDSQFKRWEWEKTRWIDD